MTEPASVFLILLCLYLYIVNKFIISGFFGWLSYSFRPSLLLVFPFIVWKEIKSKHYVIALKTSSGFIVGIIFFSLLDYWGFTAPPKNHNYNTLVSIQSYGYNLKYDLDNFTEEEKNAPISTYLSFAVNHPFEYTKQRLLSLNSLWGPIVPTEYGTIGKILHGIRFPFFIIACADNNLILLLAYPVISVTLIQTLFFSTQRHQFAAEPFVIALTVLGLMHLSPVKSLANFIENRWLVSTNPKK
jgi:hypothetical protein